MFGFSVISLPAIPVWAGYAAIVVGTVAGSLYLRHARRTEFPVSYTHLTLPTILLV